MDLKKSISLIENRFRNLEPVATDIFRAERKSNGFTIGVFYFDFSQPLKKSTFNLNQYLQQVIATDFYQHEGSLQWNYYLYFILDSPFFNKLWKDGTAANIEADQYSRASSSSLKNSSTENCRNLWRNELGLRLHLKTSLQLGYKA